jgi:RNA polymerase alpha subunit
MSVTGRPAQSGHGVMTEVEGQIIEKFAVSLAAQLAASGQPGGSQPDADRPAVPPAGANGARPRMPAAPTAPGHDATGDAAGTDPGGGSEPGLPIEELGLPLRAFNSLRREGIHTVRDLSARSEADLLAITGLGPASVKEIKQKLAGRGLALAPVATGPAGAASGHIATGTGPAGAATGAAGAATGAAGAATGAAGAATGAAGAGAARDAGEPPAAPQPAARPPDEDAIDLLGVAGFPVLRRALPIAGATVVLLLVLLRARRRHHRRASASAS